MFDKCSSPDYGEEPVNWSGRSDSNTRPLAPHASTLPGCATPRRIKDYISLVIWVARPICEDRPIYSAQPLVRV